VSWFVLIYAKTSSQIIHELEGRGKNISPLLNTIAWAQIEEKNFPDPLDFINAALVNTTEKCGGGGKEQTA
jgi:hypothetical protein